VTTFRLQRLAVRRRRNAVLLLFLAVIGAAALQEVFILQFGEPYPALRMPSFRGTLGAGDKVVLRDVEVVIGFADGGTEQLSPHQLLAEAPDPLRMLMMSANFRPGAERPSHSPQPPPAGGVKRFVLRLVPGYTLANRRWQEKEAPPPTRRWLRRRLAALHPGRTPVAVDFRWYDDTYSLADGSFIRTTRQPYGEFRVGLNDDP
jgi:hypothetical protein